MKHVIINKSSILNVIIITSLYCDEANKGRNPSRADVLDHKCGFWPQRRPVLSKIFLDLVFFRKLDFVEETVIFFFAECKNVLQLHSDSDT